MSQTPFSHPVTVRYLEVDQQGVVFNSWYLAYFDDALTAFLDDAGLPYEDMTSRGFDVQLVHNETTWRRGVRWRDDLQIGVETQRLGTTSFVLTFDARVDGESYVTAATTYVVIATDGTGKRPIPDFLRQALLARGPAADG